MTAPPSDDELAAKVQFVISELLLSLQMAPPFLYDPSGYKYASGTSMAAPHAAGAAALLAAVYPEKTAAEIKALLTSTATPICRDGYTKYGQIDVAAAIEAGRKHETENKSGGCNAGFAAIVLIAVGVLIVSRKKF